MVFALDDDETALLFEKSIANGNWYITLPTWSGGKMDDALQMVAGADEMLETMDEKSNGAVWLIVSTSRKPGYIELVRHDEIPGCAGAVYDVHAENMPKVIWLCDVVKFVFGNMPEYLYLKQIR